jgi:hypothetical protein
MPETKWYAFTNDAYTNEVISHLLPAENAAEGVLCEDGKKRPLWRCDEYSQVMVLCHNRRQARLVFKVFKQDGNGPIRPAPEFLTSKHKQKVKVPAKV